jgi:DNA polymerase
MTFLDFETFSEADLKEVGAYRYAEHPSTDVLCAAFAIDDGPVQLWTPGSDVPLLASLLDHIVAHNVEFEKQIMRCKLGLDRPISCFTDTAAMAARMSLPRKLAEVAEFFKLDTAAKLASDVSRIGNSVCRPRKSSKENPDTRWTPATRPEAFDALYARCRQDVELTRVIYHRLLPLEDSERRIWEATIEMNERGILIDLDSIPLARAAAAAEAEPLELEFELLVGEKMKSPVKVAKALGLDCVDKTAVRKALRDPATPPATHRALSILQKLSKSSLGKLDAMEVRAHADRRVRGSFMYCGAERTGRWSGSGIQPQNFKRGLGVETPVAFEALRAGALDLIFTGAERPPPDPPLSPTGTVAEMMRGFLLGPFEVGDFSQIEARVLNWLAGQADMLELFRTKGDPYKAMASRIYGGKPVDQITKSERFMGKQAVLGAGYGLGDGGFQFMLDDIYDVQITDEFAKQVIGAYRTASPDVVAMWQQLNDAFTSAVFKKSERIKVWSTAQQEARHRPQLYMGTMITGGMTYAYIELPSGRKLYYADPGLVSTPRGPSVRYFGRDRFSKGWTMVRTYGGKIAENITQAVSRDILATAMLRLADAGYQLVMSVHDEKAVETRNDLDRFRELMLVTPKWADGLPLDVEVFETMRYRK